MDKEEVVRRVNLFHDKVYEVYLKSKWDCNPEVLIVKTLLTIMRDKNILGPFIKNPREL